MKHKLEKVDVPNTSVPIQEYFGVPLDEWMRLKDHIVSTFISSDDQSMADDILNALNSFSSESISANPNGHMIIGMAIAVAYQEFRAWQR